MSGRDVAIAAILGAEEFGFATAPLVTLGCAMMRVCNLDTCPMGIATQNPELRKRFVGKPEYVENFMIFIARELREYMAKLGVRTLDELVGRTDFLKKKEGLSGLADKIDVSRILYYDEKLVGGKYGEKDAYDFELEKTADEMKLLGNKAFAKAIKDGKKTDIEVKLHNIDRSFGTLTGAEIVRNHKEGLDDDTITVNVNGVGGQSFGAFIPKGMTISLTGDVNDYLGKGLSGGTIAVHADKSAGYDPEENVLAGNVALYGATSGKAFIAGRAGERFCVRNSGATAVVEGVGEHGCEYMTGGKVVVLGPTDKNFAAGMSGGIAYVLDEDNRLYRNLNKEQILVETIESTKEKEELKAIIEEHVKRTGSKKGQVVLDDFTAYLGKFKKIIPGDYKKIVNKTAAYEERGLSREEAQIEAFNELVNVKKG